VLALVVIAVIDPHKRAVSDDGGDLHRQAPTEAVMDMERLKAIAEEPHK
jgi:hypothetical protein